MTSTPRRLLTVLLVCMAMLTAACGGGDNAATDTEDNTTTTPAPSGDTDQDAAEILTDDPSDEEAEAAETTTSVATTEPPAPSGPAWPLTGVVIGGDSGDGPTHPAVVVKISNNDDIAREVIRGIDEADIVFEERIEQSATRFAAVFHSKLPTEVGSVRSGRTTDIDIVAALNNPIFAYSGANDGVTAQIREADRTGILTRVCEDCGSPQFTLLDTYRRPNATVVDVVALLDEATGDSQPPNPVFDYSDNVGEIGTPTAGVRIEAAAPANFAWDAASGTWLRFSESTPHITRDEVQIAPVNVIVMTTRYAPSRIDRTSVDAETVGSNPVTVYSRGSRVEGTWTRESNTDGWTLTTEDGEVIGLAPGQTWVSFTPGGTETELSPNAAIQLLG